MSERRATSWSVQGLEPPRPPPRSEWRRKARYHHGELARSALRRGREVVQLYGPLALTLRGVARDLGVSAAALVRHYGNIAGFRAAVAQFTLEEAARECHLEPLGRAPEERAAAWMAFAKREPWLYRFVAGETWHQLGRRGHHGMIAVPSPRMLLERAFSRGGRRDRARRLAAAIHGLALASLDGMAPEVVSQELDRAVAAFSAGAASA